jgi:hypothetical protein
VVVEHGLQFYEARFTPVGCHVPSSADMMEDAVVFGQ